MTLKKLLGLEGFPLNDTEIARRLEDARQSNLDTLEFAFNNRKVRVKVKHVSPEGMMWEYQDYFNRRS